MHEAEDRQHHYALAGLQSRWLPQSDPRMVLWQVAIDQTPAQSAPAFDDGWEDLGCETLAIGFGAGVYRGRGRRGSPY